jgi:hypothetical protein
VSSTNYQTYSYDYEGLKEKSPYNNNRKIPDIYLKQNGKKVICDKLAAKKQFLGARTIRQNACHWRSCGYLAVNKV